MTLQPSPRRRADGFSLIELVVVLGIIGVLAAVAMPMIGQYIRNFKLRGSAQQVASQLQTARAKAIMKNVQLGVIWVPQVSASAWAFEDDLRPPTDWSVIPNENLTTVLADTTQGPGFVPLPSGFTLDDPANCPGGGIAANAWGIRFNNMGAICQVGTTNCPAPGTLPPFTGTNLITFSGGDASVCVWERRSTMRRRVTITAGGRILFQ